MPSTSEFLKAILPADGWKCLAIFRNGRVEHQWFDDFDKMEMAALAADAQGATVYHGCASYRARGSRKAADVKSVSALWLDVDAGPGKSYGDAVAAYRAAEAFRAATDLPAFLAVLSGTYGLHIYWPIAVPLAPDAWLEHAHGLKQLCTLHGLKADPARTADLASILRPPGTHNRKSGEAVEVVCGPITGAYDIGAFAQLRMAAERPGGVGPRAVLRGTKTSGPIASALAASLEETRRPSYGAIIAEKCSQLAALKISRGNVPEPHWHSSIGILAYCADGDELAHVWSSGHPKYTAKETDERLARRRELDGASTCAWFADNYPDGCRGCPHAGKITSPIVLGYEDEKRIVVSDDSSPNDRTSARDLPTPPKHYAWTDKNELVCRHETRDGVSVDDLISAYPLYLESVGNAEIDEDSFSYNFVLKLPLGPRKISLSAQKFYSPEGLAYMQGKGAVIHDYNLFRKYVMASVDTFNSGSRPVTRYEQFGWKDNETAFLWGRSLYTASNVLPAAAVDEVATRGKLLNISKSGSLARWTTAANRLFARDCEPHAFALLCSFAAPLMRFHSVSEGGAILALVGPPGIGKTTAIDAAGSVWGENRALDLKTFDSKISRGVNLGVLGNLPVLYDELEKQDSEELRKFVSLFTAGSDRARATVDGGIRHEARTWQTLCIAASNRSVVELVEVAGDTDGLSCRILEFPGHLPAGMTNGEAQTLTNELKACHGWAADQYVRYLVQPEVNAWVRKALEDRTKQVWDRTGVENKYRFWVRTIGAVWVAGLLVEKIGLLAFSPERLIDWVVEQVGVKAPLDPRGVTTLRSISALSEYINASFDSMVVVKGPWRQGQTPDVQHRPLRQVTIRAEREPARFFIAEKPFKEWLDRKRISMRQLISDLGPEIVTTRMRMVTLGAGVADVPGGQVRVIEINGRHPAFSGILAPVDVLRDRLTMGETTK